MANYFDEIFNIRTREEFERLALEAFHFQLKNNLVYKEFVSYLSINPLMVKQTEQIPFLPIQFFKSHHVYASSKKEEIVFTSSGTTGMVTSKHPVAGISIYERSFSKAFELFYGDPANYCILALLPSYLEREGSSLVYMALNLIEKSKQNGSGFYLHNINELKTAVSKLKAKKQKTILLGVSYALMDLADSGCELNENFIVMETGGMKGKRKELLKEELHRYLAERFKISKIHSEYGMTELLSQAYSLGDGIYQCPPWMQVSTREVNDPFSKTKPNKSGGINVIDLANLYSCPFIATQDLGKILPNGDFEIIGRFDNSDIRGCNLLVQ
ncbi:MAG: acyl transferase [Bacteroidota bacterium]|nr:acyl transferase [Bacteroidota bacterium]